MGSGKARRSTSSILGQVDYGHKSIEQGNVKFRRSMYFVKPLKQGERVTAVPYAVCVRALALLPSTRTKC